MDQDTPASPDPASERSGERIAKLLARAGIASRREVERMIAEGRVKIGEETVTTPATVLTTLKGVTVDGKPVKAPEPPRLFIFHKPSGLITAERDPAGRPTIYTALRNALPQGTPRLMPVGRLDYSTEGLLLLTNDGELKRAMELPSSGIPRTYRARAFGDISQAQLEELIEGITIDGIRYGRIDANLERRTGRNQWIEMTITEGKNREVRRILEHLGLQVTRLMRVSYGPFRLLDLPRGAALEIRQVDVERFRRGLQGGGNLSLDPQTVPVKAKPAVDARAPQPASARPRSSAPRTEPERPARRMGAAPGRSTRPDSARTEKARPDKARPDKARAENERPGRPAGTRNDNEALLENPRSARAGRDKTRTAKTYPNRPYADRNRSEADASEGKREGTRQAPSRQAPSRPTGRGDGRPDSRPPRRGPSRRGPR